VGLDLLRLSRTLSFLLRHGAGGAGLEADGEGWYAVGQLADAAGRAIRRPVCAMDVQEALARHGGPRFESNGEKVRTTGSPDPVWALTPRPPAGPDILYHASPRARLEAILSRGGLAYPGSGPVHLSRSEGHAWRIGHRQWEDPVVLYVDASRARRDGIPFNRLRSGHYVAPHVPLRHVLNLRAGFAEQASAGGFLVDWSTGSPRIALIRVCRRGGSTWEVAKGKIEAGESPETAAVREVREEMGLATPLEIHGALGTIRYGFCTPDGAPRLKTIYLYLMEALEAGCSFTPAGGEGIDDVRWFGLNEAIAALAHPSLRSAIGRLLDALEERAAELGLELAVGG
jgi:putative RNA 2'-phosphotransferase